jgi:2-amino-4-hydroxy-6-hydroxymethyldihydropteridine diphosphokinase
MNHVVIGVASNISPEENVANAKRIFEEKFGLVRESVFRRTEPIGRPDQPTYLNGAFLVRTALSAADLKAWMREVEAHLGRVRSDDKYAPRTLDLDILIWNNEIIDEELHNRWFLVEAVKDLLPDVLEI